MAGVSRSERRTFSPEEVSEIIDTATRLQQLSDHNGSFGELTIGQLHDIAQELGIDEGVLREAVKAGDRGAKVERRAARRRARWLRHVGVFAVAIGGLALIDLVSGGGFSWFFYPAIVWGVGLGVHTLSAFQRR